MRLLTFVALILLSLCSCKSACRQLSERLCECALNSNEKTACVQRAGNNEGSNPPSPAQDLHCKELLPTCDCRLIDTPQGKIRCGLARDATLADGGF
jgi:hypothetical protein